MLDQEEAKIRFEVQWKLWGQAEKHLAGFPGATKEVDGRPYLSWPDYLKWKGRRVKEDRTSGLRAGLVVAQWNRRVESVVHDGAAILDGVRAGTLDCHPDGYGFQVSHDGEDLTEVLRRRERLLASLDSGKNRDDEGLRFRGKAQQWREMAEDYLRESCAVQVSFNSINQGYFDGQFGLFPVSAHVLSKLVDRRI